ncbi:hypothetical protein [Shewanella surugensis]|uniref:Uncharacterized protein n=1 Tax=Shewanella surugensis TaxID=212020 RepID=A0ABT0LH10_9GAMM|nr:hypothetical protein [Shewanella surugensis]MCL1126849.1 hypothetical protein [Shewanella surugensis]
MAFLTSLSVTSCEAINMHPAKWHSQHPVGHPMHQTAFDKHKGFTLRLPRMAKVSILQEHLSTSTWVRVNFQKAGKTKSGGAFQWSSFG